MIKGESVDNHPTGRTLGQAIRWGWLSAFSFLANLGLTILFREVVGLSPPLAFGIALVAVLLANFFALRYLVFDIAHLPLGEQARKFGLLTAAFRAVEWAAFSVIHLATAADYRLLVIAVLLGSSVVKFFIYRRVLSR